MNRKAKEFGIDIHNVSYEAEIINNRLCISIDTASPDVELEFRLYDKYLLVEKITFSETRSARFKLNRFGNLRVRVFLREKGEKQANYSFLTEYFDYDEKNVFNYIDFEADSFINAKKEISSIINITKMREKHLCNILEKLQAISSFNYNIIDYIKELGYNEVSLYGHQDDAILSRFIWINARYCENFKIKYLTGEYQFDYEVLSPRKMRINHMAVDKYVFNNDDIIILCRSKKDTDEIKRLSKKTNAIVIHLIDIVLDILKNKYIFEKLLTLKNEFKNVNFVVCTLPVLGKIENKSTNEEYIFKKKLSISEIRKDLSNPDPTIPIALKRINRSLEYNKELVDPFYLVQKNDVYMAANQRKNHVNIIDNYRLTTDQPLEHFNTIYTFGNSIAFGLGSPDELTISSQLQRKINEVFGNKEGIRVLNCANHAASEYDLEFDLIRSIGYKENDTVIVLLGLNVPSKYITEFIICDTQEAFERPHGMGEVFIDRSHINSIGNEKIAELLFNTLGNNNILSNSNNIIVRNTIKEFDLIPETEKRNLEKYQAYLQKNKTTIDSNKIGSIVMNCNPFTLGHRYLIETVSKKVDYLYIFVVEEDKSYFPFNDRIQLIKKGVKDFKNVKVLRSGKFIISSLTFSDYFNKEELGNEIINMSDDVNIFGTYIAPVLGITKRFVGDEPFCNVTKQYNNTMQLVLPEYNIEFEIIKRKENNSLPISASLVRKLLEEKKFNEIKEIVPVTTYQYLIDRFGDSTIS